MSTIHEADLIGISATSLNWPTALSVIWQIRDAEVKTPIVIGGVHPTMFPEYILRRFPVVDFVIRHEGKKPSLCCVDPLKAI